MRHSIERFEQILNIDYDTQLQELVIDSPHASEDDAKSLRYFVREVLVRELNRHGFYPLANVKSRSSYGPRILEVTIEDEDHLSLRSAAAFLGTYQIHIQELMKEGMIDPTHASLSVYGTYVGLFSKTSLEELLPQMDRLRSERIEKRDEIKRRRIALEEMLQHFGELPEIDNVSPATRLNSR
jgi:hypothetical protein